MENVSRKPVHDRMPLLLEERAIVPWILNEEKAEGI